MRHANAFQPVSLANGVAGAALSSVSLLALTAMFAMASPGSAQAGAYTASDEASFKAAVASANADPDPTATIALTNNITITNFTTMPSLAKTITINTGSFTLGNTNSSATIDQFQGGGLIINGTVTGQTAASGSNGLEFTNGTITNNGMIQGGGSTGGATAGAAGVAISNGTLINNGTITGGAATGGGNAGIGVLLAGNAVLIDSGTIAAGATGANPTAIYTSGANNTLEIHNGYNIANFRGTGLSDTLILGGSADSTFDMSKIAFPGNWVGIESLVKSGTSTWTLTNTSAQARPWTLSQGILKISANGALGGGAANVIFDGGTLETTAAFGFTHAITVNSGGGTLETDADLTVSSAISGAGAFTKTGTGALILTGTNPFSGVTTIQAGTLQIGAGAAAGSLAGDIVDNSVLAFNRSDNLLTFAGVVSGAGSVSQIGSGTITLTGNSTYTGGTIISAGTLQVGNGGTSGSIIGNVTDNGALIFNHSDAISLGGAISGSGSVTQMGGGSATLSGNNIYAGGTTITGGTLVGSATSFGSGAILDTAALVIDQPADAALANAINGSGSVTKQGSGRLNYTGTGSLSGPTTVAAGLLSVNGSLANSAVTVANGGSLGGNGTVGATTIQSGGNIAPGNSIGTLHVNGAFTQAFGSVYQVEVDPNTNASDLVLVNGAATLQSGAGLNVIKYVPGDYRVGTVYTVLNASGGLNGTYAVSGQTAGVSAFLGLKDSYDANNAYLTVVQIADPASAATSPNQQGVAQAVDALGTGSPLAVAVLNLPDAAAARSAFDQLSGAAQASAKGALASNGLYLRDVTFDRLRNVVCTDNDNSAHARLGCVDSDGPSLWAQGFGGWGGVAGNANAAALGHSTAGMLAGVDVPVMDWRIGFFGGYSHSDFHAVGLAAGGGSDDYHLGLYGGTGWDAWALRLGASYSWDDITTDRTVAFDDFTDHLHAGYNGGTTQLFGELGYGLAIDEIELEPFANLAYLNLRTQGFREGGGAAALTAQANTIENAITTLGVRPSTTLNLGSLEMRARGLLGWRHTFGVVTPSSTVSFSGGNEFTVTGAPIGRDAAVIEAGVDFGVTDDLVAGLTYGGQFSDKTTDQTVRADLRFSF